MANFFDRYNTDKKLEEDGVWIDFGDGLKVKVRRLSSKHSRETRRKLEKPYVAQFRNREMPDSLQDEILNKQVATSIIVDWEGVPNPDNPKEMLVFSPDNALDMIKKFSDFRDDILTAALERTTFEKEQREAARKN